MKSQYPEKINGENLGFDYDYLLAVMGIVASRHESAEAWRQRNQLLYIDPQKQERNHVNLLTAVIRHTETTPELKEALLTPRDPSETLNLKALKVDLLYNSPNLGSQ